ncbi:hypothetical protein A2303_07290 [Candidatus Falkowbacteria bacterium RIFOXYB2_FULL_47_14]|uniref:PKD domain-containing protein n=1 Tax=Candidatus Falkowbacteria bacterium RIFOXYA2_FULL_47_19 TaxID=1797994 RepID=A0A1F5SGI5_9BACT|nr:MAG: hypothetical protein A2227_01035 [Candidatus Falkowbacteria bacterium RIFOXYA2_FULL_47_19]OGF34951.1 MAG: hypothetical protein A2468_06995 [Candidatus Falkowbacteria bacterium RIFOXYC2_FULL_46_15]OGF43666.1 MAG: hypothetical protein A2303_07290 [Candidatus Falkowbacteria bacterium RIFOXYB2_FULL_47_14]
MKTTMITILLSIFMIGFFYCPSAMSDGSIDINKASLEELDSLPGIGPAKALSIIDYRQGTGSFIAIEDIMNVPGIGQSTFDGFKDLICVNCLAADSETSDKIPEEENVIAPDEDNAVRHGYKAGDILINELVSAPEDGEAEWVEIFNASDADIDLSGWILLDGGERRTELGGVIGSRKLSVKENIAGNLNNGGDRLQLIDPAGNLIDEVVYGDWDNGHTEDNVPAPDSGQSLARDGAIFLLTSTITREEENIITAAPEKTEAQEQPFISEVFAAPLGSPAGEFIELYNPGTTAFDLSGWRLSDDSGREFLMDGLILEPGGYRAIGREESSLALDNNGDSLILKNADNRIIQKLTYKTSPPGESWSRKEDGKYSWTRQVTPDRVNGFSPVNEAPAVDFDAPAEAYPGEPVIFDGGDTLDVENDELEFFWDFGDGSRSGLKIAEHTFFVSGDFNIALTVKDGANEAKKEQVIKIISTKTPVFPGVETKGWSDEIPDIIINEFLPDPDGGDEAEFIELYNRGGVRVNLLDWMLDDGEGGSRPHAFKEDFWIANGAYLSVSRTESGLSLNNSGDFVRLFDPAGKTADEVKCGKTVSGEAYARGENGKWFWTTAPTPGSKNVILLSDSAASGVLAGISAGTAVKTEPEDKNIIETTPILAKNFEAGDLLRVLGTVAVLPGVLGTQYFYITGEDGGGIQVYNYKKDFPRLKIGDYIAVQAELAITNGELRLKTKEAADMEILERREEPKAENIACAEVDESFLGSLIAVTGEIVEKKGSSFFLDDGTDEIKIFLSQGSGVEAAVIEEGDRASVTGILNAVKTGLRIMPRFPDDIVKKDIETPDEAAPEEIGQVLGEIVPGEEWELSARDKKLELFRYLIIIAGAVIAVLAGLLIKFRKE